MKDCERKSWHEQASAVFQYPVIVQVAATVPPIIACKRRYARQHYDSRLKST
jgi:hypothetical protein